MKKVTFNLGKAFVVIAGLLIFSFFTISEVNAEELEVSEQGNGYQTAENTTNDVQPAEDVIYGERLRTDSAVSAGRASYFYEGMHLDGVIFANSTIVNVSLDDDENDNIPVTFGDDVRIDGEIWRGTSKGTSDDMPLKISDTVIPTINNINNLGSTTNRWQNIYYSGTLYGGSSQFNSTQIGGGYSDTGVTISSEGNLQMDGELTINTSITSPGFDYSTPQTRYWSVAGAHFIADDEENTYRKQLGYIDTIGSDTLYAPVHLPHGAVVSSVAIDFIDNESSDELYVRLYRYRRGNEGSLSNGLMSTIATTGNESNWRSDLDTDIELATINNRQYTYGLVLAYSSAIESQDLRLGHVMIEYTINNPLP